MAKEKNIKRVRENGNVIVWAEDWLTRLEKVSVINETA